MTILQAIRAHAAEFGRTTTLAELVWFPIGILLFLNTVALLLIAMVER